MRFPRRRPILALALAALLAAGYTGFWFIEAGVVRNGLAEWTAARRAEGYTLDYAGPRVSGFPFSIRMRLDRPSLAGPDKHWRWTGEAVEAEAPPWAFRRIAVRPVGRLSAAFNAGNAEQTVEATATAATALIEINASGRLGKVTLDAEGVSLGFSSLPGPVTVRLGHVDLVLPERVAPPAAGQGLAPGPALAFRLQDLALPSAVAGPLGPEVRSLAGESQLVGPLQGKSALEALTAWRDAGGTLELKGLSLAWGPLELAGNATVALDGKLQPEGAGTANMRGYAETVDILVARGLMKPRDGALAKAALGLLARTPPEGGAKVVTAALTVQQQMLYAGPIPLVRLPTILWAQ